MTNQIRVAIVDDHPLFREGVSRLLERTPGIEVVADGSTAREAIDIARQIVPDVILLDLRLPDDGAMAASTIARELPSVRIIILTASDCDDDVASMLQLGVCGYLLKGCSGQEIVRAVQRVAAGEFYVVPSLAARLLAGMNKQGRKIAPADTTEASLSGREETILGEVSKGLTNKEIAQALNLREKTVKHYMTAIMQKLGVRNRLEAVLIAQERRSPRPFSSAGATGSVEPDAGMTRQ